MNTSLYAVAFDCADARRLAQFWAALLDRKLDAGATDDFASLGLRDDAAGRPHWMFNKVPEPKQVKNRVHVDLISPTRHQDVKRLLAIGATHVADFDEDGSQWTTLADLEGNEFDIVAANGDDERNEPASGR